jgi:hypothetical protein
MKKEQNIFTIIAAFFAVKVIIVVWYLLYSVPVFLLIPLSWYLNFAAMPAWQEIPLITVFLGVISYSWSKLLSRFNPF